LLRVVDSMSVNHDEEEKSDMAEEILPTYSRRMEFVSSPQLAQTEIPFLCSAHQWAVSGGRGDATVERTLLKFDYSSLHMPVHRVMGDVASRFLLKRRVSVDDPAGAGAGAVSSVAVIGAGCCALPAYLLTVFPSSAVVHAVEPCEEVLRVADSHFGMDAFPSTRLVRHVLDGAAFLRQQRASRYHLIVIDAFDAAPLHELARMGLPLPGDDSDDGVPAVFAPPHSLLDSWTQIASALSPDLDSQFKHGGLLVINVFGPEVWVEHVRSRIERSELFCTAKVFETVDPAYRQAMCSSDSRNTVLVTMPRAYAQTLDELMLQ
jgi:hypothetical protein